MPDEFYRSWRHEDRAYLERLDRDARFSRRERIKAVAGDAMIVGAIVMIVWSMLPG